MGINEKMAGIFSDDQKVKMQEIENYITTCSDGEQITDSMGELIKKFNAFAEKPSLLKYETVLSLYNTSAGVPITLNGASAENLADSNIIAAVIRERYSKEDFIPQEASEEEFSSYRVTGHDEHPCDNCDFRERCDYWVMTEDQKAQNCRTHFLFIVLKEHEDIAESMINSSRKLLSQENMR